MDIDTGAADKEDMGHKFSNGDNVLVVEGELQNLQVKLSLSSYLYRHLLSPSPSLSYSLSLNFE